MEQMKDNADRTANRRQSLNQWSNHPTAVFLAPPGGARLFPVTPTQGSLPKAKAAAVIILTSRRGRQVTSSSLGGPDPHFHQ